MRCVLYDHAFFPLPGDELARLTCLPDYDIFGTQPEPEYDALVELAAQIFDVPICMISLIGKDEQWLKAHCGLDGDRTDRDVSFCTHTILSSAPLVILDTTRDDRFSSNPLVTGEANVRFYAGAPLINSEGVHLGAFCLIDSRPHAEFTDVHRDILIRFAAVVSDRLDARRAAREGVAASSFGEATRLALVTADARGIITFWNAAAHDLFGHSREDAIGQSLDIIMPQRFRAHHRAGMSRMVNSGKVSLVGKPVEVIALHHDGHEFPIEMTLAAWEGRSGIEFGAHVQDITARRAREADLHHLAHHDDLTGLLNRNGFRGHIDACLAKSGRAALLMLDLDCFKSVNDTLGHPVGDALLQTIALRMTACLIDGGVIARIGGDEFALLLPQDSDLSAAESTAQSLLDAFVEPFMIAGHHLQIGVSIGVALAPLHAETSGDLLVRADLALLRAKNSGGSAYRIFDADMAQQLSAARAFKDELRQAYLDRQWTLFYQPQVDLSDGRLIGAEALLRWHHPERGLLLPSLFIPVLETHLLAYEVGCWVIDEACRQLTEWRQDGVRIDRVSVNLFAAQIRAGTLEGIVSDALQRYCLQPSDLELEITETIVLRHDDGALEPLRRLHEAGVAIAFDDFGTGFASLSTLKRFPLSRLKIDRSFVDDICGHSHSTAIVRAVTAMGQGLGLQVIAEGIETLEQEHAIKMLGCNEGQGYLYGRPMDGTAFCRRFGGYRPVHMV